MGSEGCSDGKIVCGLIPTRRIPVFSENFEMTTKSDMTTSGGSKYLVDGVILSTAAARESWYETKHHDGRSEWVHQKLYLSRKGRYWIEHNSDWQGAQPHAEFVNNEAAFIWLRLNDYEIPADLASYAESCEE
jgi:hypothetical protein